MSLHRLVGALLAFGVVLLSASPALAHTAFESSTPADGDTVELPVTEISLTFTGEATPAGEGFQILDPTGTIRSPDEVTSVDNLTWILTFDEALAGGDVGVRWKVAAPDTHPIEGSFSFTVTAPTPTTTTAPPIPSTTIRPSIAPPVTAPTEPSILETPSTTSSSIAVDEEPGADASTAAPVDLDAFLDTSADNTPGASFVGALGRIASLFGTVGALGGAVFAAFVLRGDAAEVQTVLRWVRRSGALVAAGAITEGASTVASISSGWSGLWSTSALGDVLGSSFGVAVGLRLAAGLLIFAGVRHRTQTDAADDQWRPMRNPAALAGGGLLLASFLFDGHTVSEGPRWLHALANVVHVGAAATWVGGVLALVAVIRHRRRNNAEPWVAQLAARFSVVATIALIAVAAAGTALAIIVLDSVSELWSTTWGRLLIAKVALVALAAIGGGYNHRVMVPALEQSPADVALTNRFRAVVTGEAAILVAVTVLTALLIAASAA